jgi:hypothetical protein
VLLMSVAAATSAVTGAASRWSPRMHARNAGPPTGIIGYKIR